MARILFVTLEYPPQVGGVAHFYQQLVEHCPNDSVEVLTNEHDQLLNPWIKSWFVLWKKLRSNQYDCVVVGHILPLGTVVWLLSLVLKFPYVVFTHGMDITVPQHIPRKRWLMQKILGHAKTILTISEYTKAQLVNLITSDQINKIKLLPPGPYITPQTITPDPSTLPNNLPEQFMLSVGRLVERKGFDITIQALAKLPAHVKLDYVIAGTGPDLDRLRKLATANGVSQRVRIIPNVSHAAVAALYERCQFFIMPARLLANGDVEGFGIVVLEAATFGKPAIVSSMGGMPDTVRATVTGTIVDPNNIVEITAAIEHLSVNVSWREQLGLAAKQQVEQQPNWDKKAQQFIQSCGILR